MTYVRESSGNSVAHVSSEYKSNTVFDAFGREKGAEKRVRNGVFGSEMGQNRRFGAGLEGKGENQVAAVLIADDEGAGTDLDEAVTAVEGDGALIAGVGAEEQALGAEGTGVRDGGIEEGLAAAQTGDRLTGIVEDGSRTGAEARKEIDALEFNVAGADDVGREFRSDHHRKADGHIRSSLGESDTSCGLREVFGVGSSGLVLGAEGEDVRAGEHPGVGLKKSGGADEGERGSISGSGGAKSERFDLWRRERDVVRLGGVRHGLSISW